MAWKKQQAKQYIRDRWQPIEPGVPEERAVRLTVNGTALTTLMCTPTLLEALAVGFLYNEGLIDGLDEVVDVHPCASGENVDVWLNHAIAVPQRWRRTSGCAGGKTAIDARLPLPPRAEQLHLAATQVGQLLTALFAAQELYRHAGGVHTSALSDGQRILLTAEDIGRHNSLDKLAGLMLQKGLSEQVHVVLTTGRISSEMLQKARRMGAEVVISRTSPTTLSLEAARAANITLIGYARPQRFTVYTHPQRLIPEPQSLMQTVD
jgi:FdhD protein